MEKTCERFNIRRIANGNSMWISERKNTTDFERTYPAIFENGTVSEISAGRVLKSLRSARKNRRISAGESVGVNTRKRLPAYAMAQNRFPDHSELAAISSKMATAWSKRVFQDSQNPMGAETSATHHTGVSRSGTKVFTRVFPERRLAFQSIVRESSVSA